MDRTSVNRMLPLASLLAISHEFFVDQVCVRPILSWIGRGAFSGLWWLTDLS